MVPTSSLGLRRRCEIRDLEFTQWDDSITNGIAAWNGVCSVDLKPDIAATFNDLTINDQSANDMLCGYDEPQVNEDEIWLNPRYDSKSSTTTTQRRGCTAHELGHAYGLGDHEDSSWDGVVIDSCPVCTANSDPVPTSPTSHDRSDDHQKWG